MKLFAWSTLIVIYFGNKSLFCANDINFLRFCMYFIVFIDTKSGLCFQWNNSALKLKQSQCMAWFRIFDLSIIDSLLLIQFWKVWHSNKCKNNWYVVFFPSIHISVSMINRISCKRRQKVFVSWQLLSS